MAVRILIADDNRDTCRYIVQHLRMETDLTAEVEIAYDRDAALALLADATEPFDIVIADLWMPDAMNVRDTSAGLRILEASRAQEPPAEVLIITGNSSAETALRASLTGAREYILKPIDYGRLIEVVRQIVTERGLTIPEDPLPEPEPMRTPIVGASPAMIEVMKTVGRIAPMEADVLIVGESGSGKELVAKTIHANSRRADAPFVVVNCSAIPASLLEAELFGIGRRVATEVDAREGRFMQADGGTLFLDEIGDLATEVQPKLLRAIELKEIQRVGGRTMHANVRIIAATNQNLEEAVREGTFRRDLYYRLRAVMIRVPSLRERKSDIPLLSDFFLRQAASRLQKRVFGFDHDVLPRLMSLPWNGNVRELKNAVETALLRASGTLVRVEDFPSELWESAPDVDAAPSDDLVRELAAMPLRDATAEFQRRFVSHVLRETDGNVTQAARRLGIGRTALHRKMQHLGIRSTEAS